MDGDLLSVSCVPHMSWCENFSLQLSASKTKDVIIDFRRSSSAHTHTLTQSIKLVGSFMFLDTFIDIKMSFEADIDNSCKKVISMFL